MKKPNVIAKALADALWRKRVVKSRKVYRRKPKHNKPKVTSEHE